MTSNPTDDFSNGRMEAHRSAAEGAARRARWVFYGAVSLIAHLAVGLAGVSMFSPPANAKLQTRLPATVRLAISATPDGLSTPASAGMPAEAGDIPPAEPEFLSPTGKPVGTEAGGTYLHASQLDHRPAPLAFFDLSGVSLPDDSTGTAIVQLWVDASGRVELIEIEHSTLGESLTRELVRQRRSLLFQPGALGGSPTRAIVRYELNLAPAIFQSGKHRHLGSKA